MSLQCTRLPCSYLHAQPQEHCSGARIVQMVQIVLWSGLQHRLLLGRCLHAGNHCAHAEPSVHTTEEVNADRATASWRQTPAHVEQKCMRDFQEGSEARCWSTICVLLENLRKAWKICLYGFKLIEELLMNLYLSSVGKVC